MVSFEGYYKFAKTKKEVLKITESDFNIQAPIHSNNGSGISNDSYLNS